MGCMRENISLCFFDVVGLCWRDATLPRPVYTKEKWIWSFIINCRRGTKPNQRPSHQTFLWAGLRTKPARGLGPLWFVVACLFCHVQCGARINVPMTTMSALAAEICRSLCCLVLLGTGFLLDKEACDDEPFWPSGYQQHTYFGADFKKYLETDCVCIFI